MIDNATIDRLPGAKVVDPDGDRVGTVGQVYVNEESGAPLFVAVKTGLFGSADSFIPLEDAQFDGEDLHVAFAKDLVKDAPHAEADQDLSVEQQDQLFSFYHLQTSGPDVSSERSPDAYGGSDTREARSGGGDAADRSDVAATSDASQRLATDDALTTPSDDSGTASDMTPAGVARNDAASSSRTDDDATLTRSEERLHVGTEQVQTGRVRLRKHVVTEQKTVTVPVTREELHIEREPIGDGEGTAGTTPIELAEDEQTVVLTEERPVVSVETVPVERVRLAKETVTDEQEVTRDIRHEEIDQVDESRTASTD